MKDNIVIGFFVILFVVFIAVIANPGDSLQKAEEEAFSEGYHEGYNDAFNEINNGLYNIQEQLEEEYGISFGEIMELLIDVEDGKNVSKAKANRAWEFMQAYFENTTELNFLWE